MTEFEYEITQRLADKPYLELVFSDVHDIARRIREVDDTLFIVRNHWACRFEVHSLEHRPNTLAWVIPYRRLDVRTIRRARRNNLLVRGKKIFRELDRKNERLETSVRRKRKNDMEALAKETRPLFAKMAWEI